MRVIIVEDEALVRELAECDRRLRWKDAATGGSLGYFVSRRLAESAALEELSESDWPIDDRLHNAFGDLTKPLEFRDRADVIVGMFIPETAASRALARQAHEALRPNPNDASAGPGGTWERIERAVKPLLRS